MEYVPTVLEKKLKIDSIVSIHYFEYVKGYSFEGESHSCWELVYCDKGKMTLSTGKDRQMLVEGQAFLHPPYQFHGIGTEERAANSVIVAFESASDELYEISDKILFADGHTVEALFSILKEAESTFENSQGRVYDPQLKRKKTPELYASEQVIQNYIELLFIGLIRRYGRSERLPVLPAPMRKNNGLFTEITDYMSKNLSEKITFTDLTERFSVSPTTLKKLFRKNCNCGAMEYLSELRISRAKTLLRENRLSCTEIGQVCGFYSVHHFSRSFREKLGMSPTEYVKSIKSLLEDPSSSE